MGCSGDSREKEGVRDKVREGYASIAARGGSCCGPERPDRCAESRPAGPASSCCGSSSAEGVAQAVGYSEADLDGLPDGANMGLSCGNPTAVASLRPGEAVLDLGSGGGFDVFIAARKVGPEGRVIGVDMTPEMVSKARASAAGLREETGLDNVEFRLGEIEHLPVADGSVDVVISNCVINLSPEKAQVWREIARVLKPGGRVAVADLALLKPLPAALRESVAALVGCVAGAVLVEDTEAMAKAAGLEGIELARHGDYIDRMAEWADPLYQTIMESLPEGAKPSDYVTSLYVTARRPA